MIKSIFSIFIFCFYLNADDNLLAQNQNTLYVQNLIEIEENIAKNFEKYILTEFKLPTIDNLITDDYLGSNFSKINKMGIDIDFLNTKELKIKYLITKDEYRNTDKYVAQLYNRDLYRDFTSVYFVKDSNSKVDLDKSYVEIKLQSDEAKTIFNLLSNNYTIQKVCSSNLINTYCNNNQKTFRWYNASSQWIEYSKIEFNKGNITTSMSAGVLVNEPKIVDLSVGSYIYIKDVSKYIKLVDVANSIQILKVD